MECCSTDSVLVFSINGISTLYSSIRVFEIYKYISNILCYIYMILTDQYFSILESLVYFNKLYKFIRINLSSNINQM